MESMNGLLLHLTEAQHRDHQVRGWMKQVIGLARDFEGHVTLHVRHVGMQAMSPVLQEHNRVASIQLQRHHRFSSSAGGIFPMASVDHVGLGRLQRFGEASFEEYLQDTAAQVSQPQEY